MLLGDAMREPRIWGTAKRYVKAVSVPWAWGLGLLAVVSAPAATLTAPTCSRNDVQATIDAAAGGDTVAVPAGACTWTTGITVAKAVTLAGAGGGWVKGYSYSSNSISTGSKTFTVQAGLNYQVGESIRAFHKPSGGSRWIRGTVASYSGTTLVINVTSVNGSGTFSNWNFQQDGSTIITATTTTTLMAVTESSGTIRITGMHIIRGPGGGGIIDINGNQRPVVIEAMQFQTGAESATHTLLFNATHGVVANCYFWTGADWPANWGNNTHQYLRMPSATQASWTQSTPAGALDTNGDQNLYVEDSHFHHAFTECGDLDGGMRVVLRYNVFDNCGVTSHGQDTGIFGLRWVEFYNNQFVFDDMSSTARTAPMNYYFYMRGGTGIWTDNMIQNLLSQDFGDKPEFIVTVQNLRRSGLPYGCWGGGYPAPRQVGLGRVSGAALTDSTYGYRGDSEPIYIWNNTGTGSPVPMLADYAPDQCGGGPSVTAFIQAGRDFIVNTPKPGYVKYRYPHPLRSAAAPPPSLQPPSAVTALVR